MFRRIVSAIMLILLLVAMLTLTFNLQPVNAELVLATVDLHPESLNLRSKGKWITCFIELPEGYDVADIEVTTILLNDTIPARSHPIAVGDQDDDGVPGLMVKFDRADVISYICAGVNMTKLFEERFREMTLTVTGELIDGTPFQGSDTFTGIYTGSYERLFSTDSNADRT